MKASDVAEGSRLDRDLRDIKATLSLLGGELQEMKKRLDKLEGKEPAEEGEPESYGSGAFRVGETTKGPREGRAKGGGTDI